MKYLSGRSGLLYAISAGAGFGVIGNLWVASYYRIADDLGMTSLGYDISTCVISGFGLLLMFYVFQKKMKEYAESDAENA